MYSFSLITFNKLYIYVFVLTDIIKKKTFFYFFKAHKFEHTYNKTDKCI